jgi:hypothetical protein
MWWAAQRPPLLSQNGLIFATGCHYPMVCVHWQPCAALFALMLCGPALAQQAETNFELHYGVVNTTFLEPAIAAYGITRVKTRF